jgi:hypothetical protein
MSKKQNILMVLESQIDKIVLGVIVLISLMLLWVYVIGNPYGEKVRIGGREISVNPGNIDRKVKEDADRLLADLEQPPQPGPYSIYDKTYAADFTQKLKVAIPAVAADLPIPYPGVGEAAIEEDRQYAMPAVPNLTEVQAAVLRGAALVPVEEVTAGMPYEMVETKVEDMDLVTVSAKFDLRRLYDNFRLSFAAPGLKPSWRDDRLAGPVLAQFELQRSVKLEDGTFSEWTTVPRTKIDPYKKLIEQLPLHADDMQFGVNVWIAQYQSNDVQLDILQPDPYLFRISQVAWMPPQFLQETFDIMKKEEDLQRREALEERRRNLEADRRTTDRTGGTTGGPRQTARPGVQPRGAEPTPAERVTTSRRPAERTLQNVERDMQNAMLKETVRLDSLRDPVMVWVHDDTVQPGKTYKYRVRLGVFNPITGKDWFLPEQAALKEQTVLWSDYAEPAKEVQIPKMLHVFPIETVKDDSRAVKGVKVEVAKYYMGQWQTHQFDVYPGQPIGYPVEQAPKDTALRTDGMMDGARTMAATQAAVDYTSGMTLVDIVGQVSWGTNLRRTEVENMLYHDTGTMAQLGIGQSNWSTILRESYKAVQDAMAQEIQQRDIMMNRPRGMDGPRGVEGPRGGDGPRGRNMGPIEF